jgi:host factor-I protein
MTLELDTGLPSTKWLQGALRDKQSLEVKLVTGDVLMGTLRWQDPQCLCIDTDGQATVVWRSAIAYLKFSGAMSQTAQDNALLQAGS